MLGLGDVTYSEWNELDYLGSEEAMMGYLQEALEGEGIAGYLTDNALCPQSWLG